MGVAAFEELAKLETEKQINDEIMKELVLESRAKKDLDAKFKEALTALRESRVIAEKTVKATILEAEAVKAETWKEVLLLEKERAAIESEKNLVSRRREELVGLIQMLCAEERNIQLEKSRLTELKNSAEKSKQDLLQLRSEIQTKVTAIRSARLWTEDEAMRALAHTNILLQSRKHWGLRENSNCQVDPGKSKESPVRGKLQNREGAACEGLISVRFLIQALSFAKQKSMALLHEAEQKSREMLWISAQKLQGLQQAIATKFLQVFPIYIRRALVDAKR